MSKKDETIKALKKKNKKLKDEVAKLKSTTKAGAKAKTPNKKKAADKKTAPAPAPARPERMKVVPKESSPPARVVAVGN